jgi:hypothetical protein
MDAIFKHLNKDIIGLILSYDMTIKERNGIYMNQIPKTDYRYILLKNIPKKQYLGHLITLVYFKIERTVLFTICLEFSTTGGIFFSLIKSNSNSVTRTKLEL